MLAFRVLSVLLGAAHGVYAGASPRALDAQAATPRVGPRYEVTFDSALARARSFRVAMTLEVEGRGPVLLSMPAWTPGSYELTNFARSVSGFAASVAEGARPAGTAPRPLRWSRADHDTWSVEPDGASMITVSFLVRADSTGVDGAWARPDFAFFNGTNVFPYIEGQQQLTLPALVVLRTEPGWRVATGMRPAPGGGEPSSTGRWSSRTFLASGYHELVDMPFFVGKFDLDSARVADRWVRLATYPAGGLGERARPAFWRRMERIMTAAAGMWGETPFPDYTALLVLDLGVPGIAALEHRSSFLGVSTPLAVGTARLPQVVAHEIFHAWNGKWMRPADLFTPRYDAPQPTPWLWVVEGVTDYYADLLLARSGVMPADTFVALTTTKIRRVLEAPPVALEDVSRATWVAPTDGSYGLEYEKGSLVGLALDVLIRDASDGARSLDDVMRDVAAATRDRGYAHADWWGAVRRAAGGRSFDWFDERFVRGREPLPLDSLFRLAGWRLAADTVRAPRLGLTGAQTEAGAIVVTSVDAGSTAATAGVQAGDELRRVGEVIVASGSYGVAVRERYKGSEGLPLAFVVRRGGRELTLAAPLQFSTRIAPRLAVDSAASPRAVRIREALLGVRSP